MPLLGALQYNEWFTGVDASNMKMVTIEYNFEIYVIYIYGISNVKTTVLLINFCSTCTITHRIACITYYYSIYIVLSPPVTDLTYCH